MIDECKPPEGAQNGSLHWVTHSSGRSEVWVWRSAERLFMRPGRDFYVVSEGWRYVAPASPDDAAALAEARAEMGLRCVFICQTCNGTGKRKECNG
jgi:hypothetical protein